MAQTTPEVIADSQPERATVRGSSREKWFALIGFLVVTAFAVALLFPR